MALLQLVGQMGYAVVTTRGRRARDSSLCAVSKLHLMQRSLRSRPDCPGNNSRGRCSCAMGRTLQRRCGLRSEERLPAFTEYTAVRRRMTCDELPLSSPAVHARCHLFQTGDRWLKLLSNLCCAPHAETPPPSVSSSAGPPVCAGRRLPTCNPSSSTSLTGSGCWCAPSSLNSHGFNPPKQHS